MPEERKIKKESIINLIKEAALPFKNTNSFHKNSDPLINVEGSENIIAGGDVHINKKEIKRYTFKPAEGNLTSVQAKVLQDLVYKAAENDVASGMTKRQAMAKWWSILKNNYNVSNYREIPCSLGDQAANWLRQEVAKNRSKKRRTVPETWRKEIYTGIYARTGELNMSKGELYALANERLNVQITSLKQLGEKNLKKLYGIIFNIKQK